MGNCYTLHPQDQQFQGGVHQPKKNLFRHSQDSFSWQNSQEQIQREPVNDGRQPSGFYEPQFPRVMAVEKDIRNPVSQDPYPLVSDWEARSGVKEYGRQEEPFAPNMLGWHQNHHNQPQAIQNLPPAPIGWSPDPHAMNQQEVLSHSEADRFLSQGNSQWQVSETPSPQRQPESRGQAFGSPSQFVSLTPSGNMFPHEPSAPVGEASVFLIGGKSTFRSTDALVEQGMRLPTRGQGLQIKQQNQRIINSVMISKLPEKAPTVVSRCERMNPESYAVQVTRTELPLQSYGNFGKRKEEGPFLLSDGGTYIGTVEGEHPHGKGKWIGKEGQMYEGGWKDGLWNGEGRFISSTGDIYQGSWESGKKSGKGLMQLLCGYLYRGQWQDDLPHGLGHQREPNGDVYDGPFVLGIKEGEGGEFKCAATGEIHTGKFEQGCLMFGKVIRPKEMEEYEGWLKLGLYDGVGELRCSEGVYNGEFVSGRRHGKGSMVYDGGMTEYQGGWKWGRQDGQGKIIHKPTGRVEQEGYWKAGKFINADIKFGKSELSSLHSNIRQDTSSNSWY